MTQDEIDLLLGDLSPEPLTLIQQAVMDASFLITPPGEGIFSPYRDDPVGYVRDVLKMKPWSMQEDVLRLCAKPPDDDWHCKLALGAGTGIGKSAFGGMIINWMFDCRGPCLIPTTAPSQQAVIDVLWKEVRVQRGRVDPKWGIGPQDFIGPQAPAMRRGADWWAKGYVAAKSETFKGRHGENMMFLFDEAVGISDLYFTATKTMFKPDGKMLWICLYNPTDTSSPMYQEIIHPESDWTVMELSSLEHPNILAGLRGEPEPIPAAVSLAQMEAAMRDDCEEINPADASGADFAWPPGSGRWWRPGKAFQWAFLGQWPTGDDECLWSDALWKSVTAKISWLDVVIPVEEIPRIGCDIATKGFDKREIHVSWGDYSVHHESRGQVRPVVTCGRLIELAEEWAARANKERAKLGAEPLSGKQIPIMVDDDQAGGVIADRLREQGYRVFSVGAATTANRPHRYPNKRSELWFQTAERARMRKLHMGLLPRKILDELKRQAVSPTWEPNSAGQRVIEDKDRMRQRLGRSPDGMDSVNLSYFFVDFRAPEVMHLDNPAEFKDRFSNKDDGRNGGRISNWRTRHQGRRRLFGK